MHIKALVIPCWLETQTLELKLLRVCAHDKLITSDNPVVALNPFCAGTAPQRSFAGYSRSGFQLILPISPTTCILIYDPKVYKIGGRKQRVVDVESSDVELLNSLQIQSAEQCIYFDDPRLHPRVEQLVQKYGPLRKPIQDVVRRIPSRNANEGFLHLVNDHVKLPTEWRFSRYRRNINGTVGGTRNSDWSAMVSHVMEDMRKNPSDEPLGRRMKRVIAQM